MVAFLVREQQPFVSVTIHVNGQTIIVENVLLDTGSVGSIFRSADLEQIGFRGRGGDHIVPMEGIGGAEYVEYVVETEVDRLEVGEIALSPCTIHLGDVNYGFGINGILGFDFLQNAGVIIDIPNFELRRV